jgi:hypothetical protein
MHKESNAAISSIYDSGPQDLPRHIVADLNRRGLLIGNGIISQAGEEFVEATRNTKD